MNGEEIIQIPLVNQHADTGHVYWAPRTCALCSLKMLMMTQKPELKKVSIMELVSAGLEMEAYDERYGWRHEVLVRLAEKYGIKMKYAQKFYKTDDEKEIGMQIINGELEKNRPVMVSIYYMLDKQKGGHIVLINGFKKEDGTIIDYYIQDPAQTELGHNYFLTKERFADNWRGGLLYLSD